MIGVSTKIFDLNGAMIFPDSILDPQKTNENRRRERRMSRTATLNGGVAVYDTGYAAGDRDINIRVSEPTKDIEDWMAYIVENYSEVIVTTEESVFNGNPSLYYTDSNGAANMTINLTEEIGG